jgi:hypothetical protein
MEGASVSQHIDVNGPTGYQAHAEYAGTLYEDPQARGKVPAVSAEQGVAQPREPTSVGSRHRLILAICSHAALAASMLAFLSALETDPNSDSVIVSALIGLGLVCAAMVAINLSFTLHQ